jgi:lincosamide nucleotidyltransferase
MDKKEFLLTCLEAISFSLGKQKHTLALIGLGSVGLEIERLDDFSDLDLYKYVVWSEQF